MSIMDNQVLLSFDPLISLWGHCDVIYLKLPNDVSVAGGDSHFVVQMRSWKY